MFILTLPTLRGGCFQAQLYGPVYGGEDSASNHNREEDPGYNPVSGSWRAIVESE